MFHIILHEPEIPPNTGNVIRLAANTGSSLTLVKPLGFKLTDSKLKRAGLDYREWVDVRLCENLDMALEPLDPERTFAFSTKGTRTFSTARYQAGDALLFGAETRGLPREVRDRFGDRVVRIPMLPTSRSLNLGNSVAIAIYEAWRQLDFAVS